MNPAKIAGDDEIVGHGLADDGREYIGIRRADGVHFYYVDNGKECADD